MNIVKELALLFILATFVAGADAAPKTKIVPIKDYPVQGVIFKTVCYGKRLYTMAIWVRSVSIVQVMDADSDGPVPVYCKK